MPGAGSTSGTGIVDLLRPAAARSTEHGGREEALYLPVADGAVLAVVHEPAVSNGSAVVFCSSLFTEVSGNQRRELQLARVLAARGVASIRIQARGTGHARDGSEAVPTTASLFADARAGAAEIRRRGGSRLSYLGYRLGALAASAAAAVDMGSSLILWDPVLDGGEYVRQARRADRVARLRRGPDEIDADEPGIFGYSLESWTEGSLAAARITRELPGERDISIVVREPRQTIPVPLATLMSEWSAAGHRVRDRVVVAQRAWWFVPEFIEAVEDTVDSIALLDALCDCVESLMDEPVPR